MLQVCLRKLGYELNGSCSKRVGRQITTRVRHFLKQLEIAKGRKRQRIKAETWFNIVIFPTEVHLHPFHAHSNHRSKEAKFTNITISYDPSWKSSALQENGWRCEWELDNDMTSRMLVSDNKGRFSQESSKSELWNDYFFSTVIE